DSDDGSHCLDTVVAADIIADAISSALSTERAAHAETRRELLEMEKSQMRQASACGMATSRAEAAEAQRDEALKALEPFAKAGELFPEPSPDYAHLELIWRPAAG